MFLCVHIEYDLLLFVLLFKIRLLFLYYFQTQHQFIFPIVKHKLKNKFI